MSDDVLTRRSGAVTSVTLNRPDRLNAFNGALRAGLFAALNMAAEDKTCRAVILQGEGRGFSAGQDLADIADGADLASFSIPGTRRSSA